MKHIVGNFTTRHKLEMLPLLEYSSILASILTLTLTLTLEYNSILARLGPCPCRLCT